MTLVTKTLKNIWVLLHSIASPPPFFIPSLNTTTTTTTTTQTNTGHPLLHRQDKTHLSTV